MHQCPNTRYTITRANPASLVRSTTHSVMKQPEHQCGTHMSLFAFETRRAPLAIHTSPLRACRIFQKVWKVWKVYVPLPEMTHIHMPTRLALFRHEPMCTPHACLCYNSGRSQRYSQRLCCQACSSQSCACTPPGCGQGNVGGVQKLWG